MPLVHTSDMRSSITAAEIGLALIFMSRSFTRLYQRGAVAAEGLAGARAAEIPGSGVVPAWVSMLALVGWATALAAGAWLVLG
jgi:hypothetical protein